MATLICPKCGRTVWSEALRCMHCDTPIEVIKQAQQKESVIPEEPKKEDAEEPKAETIEQDAEEPKPETYKQEIEEPKIEDNKVALGLIISALLQRKTAAAKPVEKSKPWYEEHYSDDVDTSDILTSSRNRILYSLLFFVIAVIAFYGYMMHGLNKPLQTLRVERGFAKVYYENSQYAVVMDSLEEDGNTTNWKLTFMSDNESTMVLDNANNINSSLTNEYLNALVEKPTIKAYMQQSTNINLLDFNETLKLTIAFSTDNPVAYIGTYWENTMDSTFAFTKHSEYFYNHEIVVIDCEGNVHLFHVSDKPVCQLYEVDDPQGLAKLFAENERLYFILRDNENERGDFFMMHPIYGNMREKILWFAK